MRKSLIKQIERVIPLYSIIPLLSCLIFNGIVYYVFRLFVNDSYHFDFTSQLDRMIPFVPAWVSIYLICYLFWIVNYILIGRLGKDHLYRFVTADLLSRLICGLFFIFLPTTNIRPEITGSGFWEQCMAFVYAMDEPTNLFPSIHCLCSWYCYLGIRKQKRIPLWYQRFSLIFAVLVCASTQFTKQHYLIDILGGVGIAQLCYSLSQRFDWYLPVKNVFEKINRIVWRN